MRKKIIIEYCLFIVFFVFLASSSFSSGIDVFSKGNEIIDVTIDNLPLNQAVKELSTIIPFDMKGSIPSDEAVSVSFKNISVEELLKRILKGYNYVFIKSSDKKPMLMVMGRADRAKYVDIPEPQIQKDMQVSLNPQQENPAVPPFVQPPQLRQIEGRNINTGVMADNREVTETKTSQEQSSIPVFSGGRAFISSSTVSSSSSIQAKAVERSLLPPSPPSIAGIDTPPSPPVVADSAAAEAPPSIPTTETAQGGSGSTASTTTVGSASSTGTQTKTAIKIEDLRPPQIPNF